jgi:hypothetical protein
VTLGELNLFLKVDSLSFNLFSNGVHGQKFVGLNGTLGSAADFGGARGGLAVSTSLLTP